MICETINSPDTVPKDAITHWQDNGNIFCLREIVGTVNDLSVGDAEIDRVYVGGTSAAVWCIGEIRFAKHTPGAKVLTPKRTLSISSRQRLRRCPFQESSTHRLTTTSIGAF